MNEVRANIDQYWILMSNNQMGLYAVDFVVPNNTGELEVGQTSRVANLVCIRILICIK